MQALTSILTHLDGAAFPTPAEFDGWQIQPVGGGANNLLYHIQGDDGDFAVKFTLKDDRRRSEREYNALAVLQSAGLDIAPRPILLEMEAYSKPVIVQSWLPGALLPDPPQTDADWTLLLDHLMAIHRVPPEHIPPSLPRPVLSIESPDQCREVVRYQLSFLPPEALPEEVKRLLARYEALALPDWDAPQRTLVRSDSNPRNFIRHAVHLASVDWEYSGAGDPVFEIADMIGHAAYMDVPRDRWEWVIDYYCSHMGGGEIRLRTYWQAMVMWWVVRFVRYAYEIPRGKDERLAQRPANWRETGEAKFQHYLALAEEMI
jgi:aminoglycoside phosphotransferase (APT) family kinase protein